MQRLLERNLYCWMNGERENMETYKPQHHFFWCLECDTLSLFNTCCGNTSCTNIRCNVSECKDCKRIKDFGDFLPEKKDVPHTKEDLILFFEQMDRIMGKTEAEIKEKREQMQELESYSTQRAEEILKEMFGKI